MMSFFRRGLFFTALFLVITAIYLYLLVDVPLKNLWGVFYDIHYSENLYSAILFYTILTLAWGIAFWATILEKSKEKQLEHKIIQLLEHEELLEQNKKFTPQIDRALLEISNTMVTQRKSLQRITNEKAEREDKLIQERLVQERQRLARELHDSVSQQLFAASMLLSALTETNKDDQQQTMLQQIERIVQQAQLEMRALLLHLRPAALNNKSLKEGLEELLDELIEKVYFDIHYKIEDVPLSKGAEDHLFRIAQETLSNTLRHAQATEVDVLFVGRGSLAIFRVQDNGIGFKEDEGPGGSYGLQNVKERAIEVGGQCKIVSVPSQGTIVEVQIPMEKGEDQGD